MKMIERLLTFVRRPTSLDIIINTAGNYLGVAFSAFFVYLLVRVFSPSEYGVFSVLFSIAYVLANILDFGTTATIYSYLPPLIESKQKEMYRFIKSTFFYQTMLSSVIIIFLFIFFPTLDKYFFKTGAPISVLYFTALSVLFFIWQNFLGNCLYAAKRVLLNNIYANIANIIKTVIILIMAATHSITVSGVIIVFGIVGPIISFILVFLGKKGHVVEVLKAPVASEDFRFRYTMTYFAASQFFNLGQRMDLFLLSYFRPKNEVGYYGLAQKIILTIIATVVSITQVISPQFSRITSRREFFKHIKSAVMYMMIPTALFILLAVTPDFLFVLVFTKKFLPTAAIARSMAIPYFIYGFLSLAHLFLLYTVKKPSLILFTNIILFLSITVVCYVFIPVYGMKAAIYSLGAGYLLSCSFLAFFAVYEYRKMK